MKKNLLVFLFLLFVPISAQAFLGDRDPKDFFEALAAAPDVLFVKVQKTEILRIPAAYLSTVEIQKKFKDEKAGELFVFEEKTRPNEKSIFQAGQEFLVFLDVLPSYTTYASLQAKGRVNRLFGPKTLVIPLNSENRTALETLIHSYLGQMKTSLRMPPPQSSLLAILLSGLQSKIEIVSQSAAQKLLQFSEEFMTQGDLSKAQETVILQTILNSPKDEEKQLQLLKVLKNFKRKEGLQALAKNSEYHLQWPAVRALQDLGVFESIESLQSQFQAAPDDEKLQILPLIIERTTESPIFLTQLFQEKNLVKIQLSAIDLMIKKGKTYENILLQQLSHPDETIKTASMMAVAKIGSDSGVPILIKLLADPLPQVREAAKKALENSQDPRAQEVIKTRFERMGEGHAH